MKKKIWVLGVSLCLAMGLTACADKAADLGKNLAGELQNQESKEVQNNAEVPEVSSEVIADKEGKITFTTPADFVCDETGTVWNSTVEQVANINYTKVGNDGSFNQVTQVAMEVALEGSLTQAYGTEIDVDITKWENIVVDGYDAIDYVIEYAYMDLVVVQRQIIINAPEYFHYVTMTGLSDSIYLDDFDAVVASIKFE